jgi:hypothetical protein
MEKITEPPTPPTYEDLKNLNSDDLLDVDINSLPTHLHSYIVGRLDELKQSDEYWSVIYEKVWEKMKTERILKEQALEDVKTEQADKQRIVKYQQMKKAALSFKSNDRTLGELYTKYSFDEKGNMTSYKNDREIIALHENKKYEPLNKFKYDEDDMMKWTEWCFDIVDRYNRQDAKGQINGLKMNQINTLAVWLKYRDKEKTCEKLGIKMGSLNTNLRRIRIKLKDTPFVNHVKI